MSGFYRKFIKDYATIAKPLTNLLKKGEPFIWEIEQESAFNTLKQKLCEYPILILPDFTKDFYISCDASDIAISAILEQLHKDGKEHVIADSSRLLTNTETFYSVYHRELLATVFATEQYRSYIYGKKFFIISDHLPLKSQHNSSKVDQRACNLRAKLMNYDFEVIYRPGPKNSAADALSRNPVPQEDFLSEKMPRSILYDLAEKKLLPEKSSESDSPNFLLAKETHTDFSDELIENNYDSDSFSEYSSESDSSVYNYCHNKRVTFQVSSDSESSTNNYNPTAHIFTTKRKRATRNKKVSFEEFFESSYDSITEKKKQKSILKKPIIKNIETVTKESHPQIAKVLNKRGGLKKHTNLNPSLTSIQKRPRGRPRKTALINPP